MKKTVVELFAGVGGFRVGLNDVNFDGKKINEKRIWDFVWFNQWEPANKLQYAYECYANRFNERPKESNLDISLVNKKLIPNHTLLLGGFPCQDYSVAHGNKSKGIQGKKGVLWWSINEILIAKKPPFVLLENVDRLLKSPTKQRGRDFGVILKCFNLQGYEVEWQVINGAEYGYPQKRKRTFIFAYRTDTNFYKTIIDKEFEDYKKNFTVFKQFSNEYVEKMDSIDFTAKKWDDLANVTDKFKFNFQNSGWMHKGVIYTQKVKSIYSGKCVTLGSILESRNIEEAYFLNDKQKKIFSYLKGKKRIKRIKPNGEIYYYGEGSMSFPENLKCAGRTMLTSEGTVNRSSHAVVDKKTKKIRFLTPVECERMNQFPDNWTNTMPIKKRYFMMGNALITGIIKKIGIELNKIIDAE